MDYLFTIRFVTLPDSECSDMLLEPGQSKAGTRRPAMNSHTQHHNIETVQVDSSNYFLLVTCHFPPQTNEQKGLSIEAPFI